MNRSNVRMQCVGKVKKVPRKDPSCYCFVWIVFVVTTLGSNCSEFLADFQMEQGYMFLSRDSHQGCRGVGMQGQGRERARILRVLGTWISGRFSGMAGVSG